MEHELVRAPPPGWKHGATRDDRRKLHPTWRLGGAVRARERRPRHGPRPAGLLATAGFQVRGRTAAEAAAAECASVSAMPPRAYSPNSPAPQDRPARHRCGEHEHGTAIRDLSLRSRRPPS